MKTMHPINIMQTLWSRRLSRTATGRAIFLRGGLALWVLVTAGATLFAGPVVDNNAGYFSDDYANDGGILSSSQVQVNPPGTVSLVSGNTSGSYVTRPIVPTSFRQWGQLTIAGNFGALGDLKVTVFDQNGVAVLIPQQPLNGPINLASLNLPTLVPGIRVRVDFNKAGALAPSPSVDSLRVTWQPVSLLLLDKQGTTNVQAGDNIVYRLRYSVSYVNAEDLVVWDTLPAYANDTLIYPTGTPYPLQNDNLTFVSANNGGEYTELGKTVNGVPVPPNSVYWALGRVPEGITDLLSFTVATKNGTLDRTIVTNCAYAKAANATMATSPCVVTTIRSVPAPFLDKQQGAAIFNISGALQTREGITNGFTITAQNRSGNGRETMYNAVLYDDVSGLVGVIEAGASAAGFFNISPGDGTFNPAYDPDGLLGPLPAIPAIVWNPRTLAPGATFFGSFSVRLRVNPPQTTYFNRACLTSDQTKTSPVCDRIDVRIGLDETPSGFFAKGDNASGSFSIQAATDDNPASAVPYGETVGFALKGVNTSVVKLNDLVFLDKVPDHTKFNRAWFNDPNLIASGAKVFYSTSTLFTDPNNPPPVAHTEAPADLDQAPNTYWAPLLPANPADVTWVAFYIPQLDSIHLPNQDTPALPSPPTPIPSAVGYFDVKVFSPAEQCTDTLLSNRGLFRVYERTVLGGTPTLIANGGLSYADVEEVVAKGYIGRLLLAGRSSITPDPVPLPTLNSIYRVTIQNSAAPTSDALTDVEVVLQLSQVLVNNEPRWPSVQNISPPGTHDGFGKITINLNRLSRGESRDIQVRLGLPAGILNDTPYYVTLTATGHDNQCGSSTITDSARGRVLSSPKLSVFKRQAADLIPSGAEYDYELVYQNLGTAPSTETWVVERVPNKTVLVRAFGNPNITGVWFSAVDNLPPQSLTPFNRITGNTIASHFTKGIQNGNIWTPDGIPSDQARWIAWKVDESGTTPSQLPLRTPRTVGFRVRNDDDGRGPGTAGSDQGTCLYNSAAIFSSELLQAIGNQVLTCIDDDPSILVQKSGPLVVEAGVAFEWVVAYHNDTLLNQDDTVGIVDTLPPGITFISATHQWNSAAVANGAPGGANLQPVVPGIDNKGDGSTVLTFPIAGVGGYRGNGVPLAGLEGGTIILMVRPDANAACGTTRVNKACGTANRAGQIDMSCSEHQVTILCADLELLKEVSPPEVLSGGNLTYTLVVANHGLVAARGVTISDTLPPGVSYLGSLSVLPLNYTLSAPVINGQTLTWSVADNNALTKTGFPAGQVPDASIPDNIRIRFTARVSNNVTGCTLLTNLAHVSTVSFDEGVYPNDATAIATVPAPDPSVEMSPGLSLARPGHHVTWDLTWDNRSAQGATGVYLVDTLPSNVTFAGVSAPLDVIRYYHSGPASPVPAFNPLNPPLTGWSTTPTIPVNHVALFVGALAGHAGPFTAQLSVKLIDPISHSLPAPGTSFTNRVTISQGVSLLCDHTNNNTATAVARTPALDVALTKTGSVQGAIPGLAPGQPITYTLGFENSGTVNAYGVKVTDTWPATLVPGNPLDNFTLVSFVDALGIPCRPMDSSGNPIVGAVPVTRQITDNTVTWYLGTTTPGSLNYTNVGLPPGCRGSFELYVTVSNSVPDNTVVCNQATVSAAVGTEEVLDNNTGQTCVTVRRADVAVLKSGVETLTGDPTFVEFGGLITYKIQYNNLGRIDAHDVVIDEIVPAGTSLVSVNRPEGSTVTYSPNPNNPTNATSFSVNLGTLHAPANSVGGTGTSNETSPSSGENLSLSINREVDGAGVTTQVTVTWDAAYAGVVLEVTGALGLTNTTWTSVPNLVTPFPPNRVGVTFPIFQSNSMPNCFFRLRGAGAPGCSLGTKEFPASAEPAGFLGWKTLLVNETILSGTDIRYSVGRRAGATSVYDLGSQYTDVNVGPEGLDLSGINPAHTNLVLRAESTSTNATNSPCLDQWKMTYASENWPCFTFTVRVDGSNAAPCGPLPIENVVSISTTTPETRLDNNTTNYNMFTRLTDLKVECGVNKAAALPGESLTNTINWSVAGPQGAPKAYVQVALADGNGDGTTDVTLGTVTPGPGVTAYYSTDSTLTSPVFNPDDTSGWTLNPANANHIVFFLGDRDPNSTNTITYTTTVKGGTAGLTLDSCVNGYTTRRETECDNTCCTTIFVGRLANVHLSKTGPGCLHPGDLAAFTIRYGNNGNTAAVNVVVSDVLPPGLTFVSAVPSTNGPGLTWNFGTLGAGESGVITVLARLTNDCTLVGQTLANVATISTSSGQVNRADDRDEAVLDCITAELVSLSGYVYEDQNGNCLREPGESGIPNVTLMLTGTDWCGVPVTLTTVTVQGQYSFIGLNPGTYIVTETQPATWASVGDALGTPRGVNTNLLDDVLGPITLFGGEVGLEYNFCESYLSLGNLVWQDDNNNGQRETGEPGLDGVTVQLWSPGLNGAIGGGDDQLFGATTTLGGGFYQFTHLLPAHYYVRIPGHNFAVGGSLETMSLSSPPTITSDTGGAGPDNRDVGAQLGGGGTDTVSPVVHLALGQEALNGVDGDNFNGMLTLDFGFTVPSFACLLITNEVMTCVSNGTYRYTFCATNLFNGPISYLTLLDAPDGVTFTPDIITLATPLQPGQGQCFTVTIQVTGPPSAELCFRVGAHTTNFIQCCAVEHCLPLPLCCAEVVNDSAVPIPGQPNCYNYTFSLRNETAPPVAIQYLILVPDAANNCFSFAPDIIFLTTPLLPGQTVTRTVKLCVTSPCPAPFCFVLSAHDTNFNLCCSIQHCLTNAPVQHRPVVFADGFDGSVYPAGTNITVPLVIDTSIVRPNLVTVSVGNSVISTVLTPTNGPLSITWSNVGAGTHTLIAAAQDEFGGIWFGDPATVVAGLPPTPVPQLLGRGPQLLAPALVDGQVRFSLRTEAGVTYHVEHTESLAAITWTLLRSAVGDGSVMTVTDSLTNAPQRFYRLRVEQP